MIERREYTITRQEDWGEDLWDEVIGAVEETVVAVVEDWDEMKGEQK